MRGQAMIGDRRHAVPIALFLVAAILWGPARAQSLNLAGPADEPTEIYADDGVEWQQENQVFIAEGNARAKRGDVEVSAQTLRAYYRKDATGKTNIWRMDAEGGVKIASQREQAFGDRAVFDVDQQVMVLSGKEVRLITPTDQISASQQLEYWAGKKMAVARGNAVAVRGDRRLEADILVAHFQEQKDGSTGIQRVEAFDNVRVVTKGEEARSDRGVYNTESGIATLTGSVKIIRDANQLSGCEAEVNLKTGVSKLRGCGGAQVRGRLAPKSVDDVKGGAKN